jgi:hypothetical protein
MAALFLLPEAALYLASARADVPEAHGHCRVLVLGFPGRRDGMPSPVQLFRMRVAQETLERYACSTMVLSGGRPHSERVEADDLAAIAQSLRMTGPRLILERESGSTWENVRDSLPSLAGPDHVFIASDPAHAQRARRYLCRLDAELCPRVHVAARFRPFEGFWYQWLSVWWSLLSAARDAARGGLI